MPAATHAPAHAAHHGSGDKRLPAHTCCGVAGKCDIKVTPEIASVDLSAVATPLPAVAWTAMLHVDDLHHPDALTLAHAPPAYLRNVSLRI